MFLNKRKKVSFNEMEIYCEQNTNLNPLIPKTELKSLKLSASQSPDKNCTSPYPLSP